MDVARLQQAIRQAIAARSVVEYADAGREIRIDSSAATAPAAREDVSNIIEEATDDPNAVVSPCFGIVHLAPAPGAAPFVRAGDRVQSGQKICLVEAMKVFSAVSAAVEGRVAEICVATGDEVAQGQILFRLEPRSGGRDV
jgi:acetyl-CoA carboxylase biotin carboxyl carrier protein